MDAWRGREQAGFERIAEVFSVLSTTTRLRLLTALCESELCVGELAAALDMSQPTVSQQLALMFRSGLLARRKDGAQVYYSVEPKAREFLCRAVHALVP